MRADDMHTIPLCPNHHNGCVPGDISVHGTPEKFELLYGTQEHLLNVTNGLFEKNFSGLEQL